MSRKTIMTNIAYDDRRCCFYVTLRTPAAGARPAERHTRCCATLQEAVELLDEHKLRRQAVDDRGSGNATVEQWLDYWLREVITPACSPCTVHGYSSIIHNHLCPILGPIPLRELTTAQIQEYLNSKLCGGLCANTVRKHQALLHNALENAVRREILPRNAASQAATPPETAPVHHFYDSETMMRLFCAVRDTSMEPVVKLAGYLGLRRGEICGLKWCNVDRKAKVITIAEARTAVNGRSVDKSTKNKSSIRRLGYGDLADMEELMGRLWRQRRREMARMGDRYDDKGFVICHDGGRPYQPDYLSARLQRILKDNDLPYITLHGLRHSFASIAHSRAVPLFDISRALGHSSSATTTKVYMHLFDETHLNVVREVGRAIGGDE